MTDRRTILKGTCGFAALAAARWTAAADRGARTFRFAFQNQSEHPQGQGAAHFARRIEERSAGRLRVQLFPAGVLGSDLQAVTALQRGTLDFTVLNSGILAAQSRDFAVLDLPFLFHNAREVDAVVDGVAGERLADALPAVGIVHLGYWDLGFRHVTNAKRPVRRPEDLAGLRIRVIQSPIHVDTFRALGAEPVPLPFPEVRDALARGTVDGQENPYTTIRSSRFDEVQKYLSATAHAYNPQSLLVGRKAWDGLTSEERGLVTAAARDATAFQRTLSRRQQDEARAELRGRMAFNELAEEERSRFRDRVRPVADRYAATIDPSLLRLVREELARQRGIR